MKTTSRSESAVFSAELLAEIHAEANTTNEKIVALARVAQDLVRAQTAANFRKVWPKIREASNKLVYLYNEASGKIDRAHDEANKLDAQIETSVRDLLQATQDYSREHIESSLRDVRVAAGALAYALHRADGSGP